MIIDTSALIAILRSEPDAEIYATAIAGDPSPRISAANYLEIGIVIDVGHDAVAVDESMTFARPLGLSWPR